MFNPNPWVKGFTPPSKCPACKHVYTLSYMGIRDQLGNHVYHCSYCGSLVGAPTDYAICTKFNTQLEKDVFYSPCSKCPHRAPAPGRGVCKWWEKKEWWGDLDKSEEVSRTIKKFYIPTWGIKGEESEG